MLKRLHLLVAMMTLLTSTAIAQVTTSGISGHIRTGSEDAIGAYVTATHQPSGTVYRAVTNNNGRYTLQGMRVGGPYLVEISYLGHKTKEFKNVNLSLGESRNLSCTLEEDNQQLDEVLVTGKYSIDATKTGAAQSFNSTQINEMPTVTHSIADIARYSPQVNTNEQSGAISFAGSNNRYNVFQIDGVMNNDVFGLTSNGSNGGQSGTQPVSMETIDQIQISVTPFDVRQSGFTGGAINAITKSGTNDFHGSAYIYGNNENLVGRHYKMSDGTYSDPYDEEHETLYGFTLGGPIVKNKLFFFANYERADKSYPNMFGYGTGNSNVPEDRALEILNDVKEMAADQGYTYNGQFSNTDRYIKSDKLGLKLDWNINDFNKLTFRWSYVNGKQLNGLGSISALNTEDHLYEFQSRTHSFSAELQTRLSPVLNNEARASYVRVRDKRTSGTPFPSVTVYNVGSQGGTVNIGNEYSSMANALDQDIFTFEDNLNWYLGKHTITFGTHNEFYKFRNLFIQNLYGCYYFSTYNDFINYYNEYIHGYNAGSLINNYYYGQANVDITGDPLWAAKFGAGQFGFYAQDRWNISDNFQLTYGLRMDIPVFFDTPAENTGFNEFAASQGWDVKTNQKLSSTPMWSPRVGFRWDVNNDANFIVRGGVGVFTGKIPFVWLSNSFSNTGVQMSSYSGTNSDLQLILDPNNQAVNAQIMSASGSQTINVFSKDFKFTQNLRFNLGFDFKALGIDWTADAIYSKTLNDVVYSNIAYDEAGSTYADQEYGLSWETRPMMTKVTKGTPYNNIYLLSNSSKGYDVSLSFKGEKHFRFGLDLSASYTYTKSKSVCSSTASVAQSNWRNNHTHGNPNKPYLANSAFNVPHSIKASAFYHFRIGKSNNLLTTVGLTYQGRSGSPYSIYNYGDMNGDGYNSNDLMYIPTDEQLDQMQFADYGSLTGDEQRENFRAWLNNTEYLRDHRGQYFERYGDNLKFENHFDFHISEKINIKAGRYTHGLEISFNIMNVGNLLNKDWGRTYSSSYMSQFFSPLTYKGNGKYQFTRDADYALVNPSSYYSRWRGQIGLKYTF